MSRFQLILTLLVISVLPAVQAMDPEPPVLTVKIVGKIPHENRGFTQGLEIYQDTLYESTGLEKKSRIFRINLQTGRILKASGILPYFGEGLTLVEGRIHHLSWKKETARIYDRHTFKELKKQSYQGEGWGLSHTGKGLFMTDGSEYLKFVDKDFKVKSKLKVTLKGKPVPKLNELEYDGQYIYANVWYKNFILRIDPTTGKVNAILDCAPLFKAEKPASVHDVLNGIAWHSTTGEFYLTGKNWKYIYRVTIPTRP